MIVTFYGTKQNYRTLSGGLHDFAAYNIFTGDACSYHGKRLAPLKREKIDDGPLLPLIAPAVRVQYLPVTTRKKLFHVRGDYEIHIEAVDNGKASQLRFRLKPLKTLKICFPNRFSARLVPVALFRSLIVRLSPSLYSSFQSLLQSQVSSLLT